MSFLLPFIKPEALKVLPSAVSQFSAVATSFVILGLCLGLLSGCSTPSATDPKTETTKQGITLEFWTLQLDAFADVLKPMFTAYERQHPGVHIHWVDVPFSEGSKRTLTAMMSDHTPDVVNLNPDFSAVLASRKALVDMNKAIPAEERRAYLPVAWAATSLNRPGEQPVAFGLPWYVTSGVTLYNRTLLKKAGFVATPKSWDELPDFVKQVRAKTGAYGIMPTLGEGGHFLKDLQTMGLPLYTAQGKAVFNQPRAVGHLSQFVRLYREGMFPAEALTESHQAAVARFQAGTLAMMVIGPNFLKILKENSPSIYAVTEVAEQFPAGGASPDFSLMVLTVPVKSAHPEEAVRFAHFITNAENQAALAKAAPVLPSVTSALQATIKEAAQASSALADNKQERGRAISAGQLLRAKTMDGIRPNQNTINQIMDYYVQLALLGKRTPADALRQAEADVNATLSSSDNKNINKS